jgi:hypothetical protein
VAIEKYQAAARFEIDGGNEQHRKLHINLAGQDTTIIWSEKHFMRLKALWDNA